MFEIKLEPMKTFYAKPKPGQLGSFHVGERTIYTQQWQRGRWEYIIVHQDGLYNLYKRDTFNLPTPSSVMLGGGWVDVLPKPVTDLLSIRCAIEELGIMPEEGAINKC